MAQVILLLILLFVFFLIIVAIIQTMILMRRIVDAVLHIPSIVSELQQVNSSLDELKESVGVSMGESNKALEDISNNLALVNDKLEQFFIKGNQQ